MLKVLVLGSAAGGGSPQWNCNSPVSKSVRNQEEGTSIRTQSSIAITANDNDWFLCNASPDLGAQIIKNKQMHPKHVVVKLFQIMDLYGGAGWA